MRILLCVPLQPIEVLYHHEIQIMLRYLEYVVEFHFAFFATGVRKSNNDLDFGEANMLATKWHFSRQGSRIRKVKDIDA